jgi:hypothetical protein
LLQEIEVGGGGRPFVSHAEPAPSPSHAPLETATQQQRSISTPF